MWFTFRPATSSRCGILTPMMICQLLSIPALAQEVVVADGDFNISASANTIDFGIATDSDTDLNNQDFQSFETIMVPQIRSVSANDPDSAASAAASSVVSVAEFLEENGQLEGTLTANGASSGISDGQGVGGSGTAATTFELEFDVIGAPAIITLSGMANTAMTPGDLFNARVELSLRSGGRGIGKGSQPLIDIVATSPPREPEDSANRTYSESLSLSEGRYTLRLQATSFAGSDTTGSYEFTLGLLIEPDPDTNEGSGEEFFWATNDGDFDTAENWEPQQVPTIDNIAIFSRDTSPYTVTIANPAVSRLIVDRGNITFEGLTLMAAGGDADIPAVIVGDSVAESVSLFMDVDNVSTFHTVVANAAATTGTVTIDGLTEWANEGPFVVGASGTGALNFGETGQLNTESLALGQREGSSGTMNVFGISPTVQQLFSGSTVIGRFATGELHAGTTGLTTGATVLGQLPESSGTAIVNEGGGEAIWEFSTELTIGDQGDGRLDAHDRTTLREVAGAVTPVYIAKQNGSDSVLTLRTANSSLTTSGDVFVGPGGIGNLDLLEGARLSASMLFIGPTFEMDNPDADGNVTVDGNGTAPEESQVDLTGDLVVGDRGNGELFITGEAIVTSDRGLIATENDGEGHATIQNATWRATTQLTLGTSDTEGLGFGLLTLIDGQIETNVFTCFGLSSIEGTGIIFAPISDCECNISPNSEVIAKGTTPVIGTLQFEGDANFNGATITIDVSSATNGDDIVISGDASLTSTTITFNFIDGYLPQTGDNLPFIMADGTLTIDDNTTLNYTGAADGFDFDVNAENGMLTFQAQNNAQPEGGEGEGEGEGEGDTEGTGETGGCAAGSGPTGATSGDLLGQVIVVLALLSLRRRRYAKLQGNRTI